MNVFFLSKPENLKMCHYLSDYLTHYKQKCVIFESQEDFFNEIMDNEKEIDLYVIDYNHFNHIILNLYNYLIKSYNCYTPLIFFNDPFLTNCSKENYWKEILNMVYGNKFQNYNRYELLFTLLSNAITDFKNDSQNTQTINSEPIKNNTNLIERNIELNLINRKITKELSTSAYIIYKELEKNSKNQLSIEELSFKIKKNEKTPKKSTILCLISEIRKTFKKIDNCNLDIIKLSDGYKLIKKE